MTYIDIHILQTVPPSNLNRDDTGSPKTGVFGGVRRARVSSQAWKRATRAHFNSRLDKSGIGYRTKRIVEIIARKISESGLDEATAEKLATNVVKASGIKVNAPKKKPKSDVPSGSESTAPQSDYLLFISAGQVDRLAALAISANDESHTLTKKDVQPAFNQNQSIDVALFGRMVADDAELNIDAAVQVAHAISVHAVDNEFDYFTAVDDLQAADKQTGAGMIGTVEFNSSTLYRYATVNIDKLTANLGDAAAAARATATFVDAFVRSMPSGKQNTFANRTLPDAVVVVARDDQPLNLVGAFEDPVVRGSGKTIVTAAAKSLASHSQQLYAAYGAPRASLLTGPASVVDHLGVFGSPISLEELVAQVESTVVATASVSA